MVYALESLAEVYARQGKYAEAEPLFQRAAAWFEETRAALGDRSYNYDLWLSAAFYYAWGKPDRAEDLFDKNLKSLAKQFEFQFTHSSEKGRLQYLQQAEGDFPLYLSFCFSYGDKNPALVGKMYDLLLWEKGLVADSIAAEQAQLNTSGDLKATTLFQQLAEKRTKIAALLTEQPTEEWRNTIDQLSGKPTPWRRE